MKAILTVMSFILFAVSAAGIAATKITCPPCIYHQDKNGSIGFNVCNAYRCTGP